VILASSPSRSRMLSVVPCLPISFTVPIKLRGQRTSELSAKSFLAGSTRSMVDRPPRVGIPKTRPPTVDRNTRKIAESWKQALLHEFAKVSRTPHRVTTPLCRSGRTRLRARIQIRYQASVFPCCSGKLLEQLPRPELNITNDHYGMTLPLVSAKR